VRRDGEMKKYERNGGKASLNSLDYTEESLIWEKMSRLYKQKRKRCWEWGRGEEEDAIKARDCLRKAATEEDVYGQERGANEVSLTNLIATEDL
jgi:hypothetical protein